MLGDRGTRAVFRGGQPRPVRAHLRQENARRARYRQRSYMLELDLCIIYTTGRVVRRTSSTSPWSL